MKIRLLNLCLIIPLLFSPCTKLPADSENNKENTSSPNLLLVEKACFSSPSVSTINENIVLIPDDEDFNKRYDKEVLDQNGLNILERNWFYKPRIDGNTPEEPGDVLHLIKKHSAYYVGDTSKKVLYLTFDEGYENGYTPKILDTLKANNVKAAFFVTTPYINTNREIIKRMVEEGHLVCNHSNKHPSMAKVAAADFNKFQEEFTITEKAFEDVTGNKMPKFFRPPMGKYSELSLDYTEKLGYKTIFWSFAYADWLPDKQPSEEYAKKIIMTRTHNGAIILLHAVSKTNANIMDSIIKEWKAKGYEFKTLNELPEKAPQS